MSSAPLTRALIDALGDKASMVDATDASLETDLRQVCDAAQDGVLPLDLGLFVAHIARQLRSQAIDRASIPRLHAADLHLALGCSRGDTRAVAHLRKRMDPIIAAAAARMQSGSWFADEVSQLLYQKLLVQQVDAPARIAEYSGRGPLEAWVRVAATRMAIDLRRKEQGAAPDDELMEDPAPALDPELDYIRLRHANDFEIAFRQAFQVLSARERNVLRMYLLDGLDIGRIGAVYQVHRATIARWIARARETVVQECHRLLTLRLGATDSEVDSLVRVVRSQVRVNLVEILASDKGDQASG